MLRPVQPPNRSKNLTVRATLQCPYHISKGEIYNINTSINYVEIVIEIEWSNRAENEDSLPLQVLKWASLCYIWHGLGEIGSHSHWDPIVGLLHLPHTQDCLSKARAKGREEENTPEARCLVSCKVTSISWYCCLKITLFKNNKIARENFSGRNLSPNELSLVSSSKEKKAKCQK